MLITTVIVLVLALIFGKITIKEIKEHVRKYKKRGGSDDRRDSGDSGSV